MTNFSENAYLSWYLPRIRSADEDVINLHSSGMPQLDPSMFSLEMEDAWSAASTFEKILSDWLAIPAEEIVFTPGATGGNLLALLALTRPSADIIVESPVYEPMLRQAQRLGKTGRLIRSYESGWKIPIDRAGELISDNTDLIIITEPHNPGAVFSNRDDVLQLAEIAAKKNALLMINEVYRGFTEAPSFHGVAENIVVVNSLSKLFGTYWMRLGWLSATEPLARKLRLAHINMGMGTAPAASLGVQVMKMSDDLLKKALAASSDGAGIVKKWVEDTDGIQWHEPDCIGFGCIRLPACIDDVAFTEKLFTKEKVLFVPGTKFEAPGTIRLSWLQAGSRLKEGLSLLSGELDRQPSAH